MSASSPFSVNSKVAQVSLSYQYAKPFLKWAGGKTQLLSRLDELLPKVMRDSGEIPFYVEPFVGGGAFFFYLVRHYRIGKAILMDINEDLIGTYATIREQPQALMAELEVLQDAFLSLSEKERKDFYYTVRSSYNAQTVFDLKRAAYLIFLNKTCYNGLYRLNRKGKFNVPVGRYKRPSLFKPEVIQAVSAALQGVELICGDFEDSGELVMSQISQMAQKSQEVHSLIYLDPPYRPLSTTASFTSYFKDDFNDQSQIRLAKFFREMDQKEGLKIFLMLSNSDPAALGDSFFDELYSGFEIRRVSASRMISRGERGNISEIVVTNYKPGSDEIVEKGER